MSTLPIVFRDPNQLLTFAEEFIVSNRLASLENDVNRCTFIHSCAPNKNMRKHLINKSQALERINSFALDRLFVRVLIAEMR
jgi:hypothetical protein